MLLSGTCGTGLPLTSQARLLKQELGFANKEFTRRRANNRAENAHLPVGDGNARCLDFGGYTVSECAPQFTKIPQSFFINRAKHFDKRASSSGNP
jgi:hypothetical protein